MMDDSAAVAHSRARHHQACPAHIVNSLRFLGSWRWFQSLQIVAQWTILDVGLHLIVEQLEMFHVNLRGLNRHRAVEKDRERLDLARTKHFPEQQRNQLSAADGER